ncbi:MAG: hypothetical protein ACOC2H_08905 [Spirochaetota bacterium]
MNEAEVSRLLRRVFSLIIFLVCMVTTVVIFTRLSSGMPAGAASWINLGFSMMLLFLNSAFLTSLFRSGQEGTRRLPFSASSGIVLIVYAALVIAVVLFGYPFLSTANLLAVHLALFILFLVLEGAMFVGTISVSRRASGEPAVTHGIYDVQHECNRLKHRTTVLPEKFSLLVRTFSDIAEKVETIGPSATEEAGRIEQEMLAVLTEYEKELGELSFLTDENGRDEMLKRHNRRIHLLLERLAKLSGERERCCD